MNNAKTITETQLLETLRQLPEPALAEVKEFLDFLTWRYQQPSQQNKGLEIISALKGKATATITTNEIMTLTREE